MTPRFATLRRVVGALVRGVRAVVGTVLGIALLVPLWLLACLLPWLFDRAVAYDPLDGRGRAGWQALERSGSAGRTLAAPVGRERASRRWHRRLRVLVALIALVALVGGTAVVVAHREGEAGPTTVAERRLQAAPHADELLDGLHEVIDGVRFSQYAGWELPDVDRPHLHVRQGVRLSWTPPVCAARRVRVWFFGGSTAFGVLQADDETIASALAKEAHRHGIALELRNFGVPGDASWQGARRLERALAGPGPKPDLVLFYDGRNDLSVVSGMDFAGRDWPEDFVGSTDREQERFLSEHATDLKPGSWRVVHVPEPSTARTTSDAEVIRRARQQYQRADRTERLLAEDAGAAFLHAFQPVAASRDRPVPGEYRVAPDNRELVGRWRRAQGVAVDLSDALDGYRVPTYYDDVHTTADANPVIARALWASVRPLVAPVAAARAERRC